MITNNNQDDTYKKLKQIPFEQIFTSKAMLGFYAVSLLGGRRTIPEDLHNKMTAGGWTEEEFLEELDRRFVLEYVVNQEGRVVERDTGDRFHLFSSVGVK